MKIDWEDVGGKLFAIVVILFVIFIVAKACINQNSYGV